MREILFRGKRLQGGEWVEGYFFKSDINKKERESGKATIIFTPDCDTFIMVPECHDSFMVVSDTVGQYTGMKDKNGKRVFEGDIVHCLARMDEANCVVIFEEGEFRLVPEKNCTTYVTGGGYHALRCFVKEVIGNVHDNPELLKGGDC